MRILISLGLASLAVVACSDTTVDTRAPVKLEIVQTSAGYELTRDGEPYRIRGAGLEFGDMVSFAVHGGNTIRNWTTVNERETARAVLDKAHANGVAVALGLPMKAERWGFDYDDAAAVAAQLAELRAEVLKYRDHPALLVWIIGNELNLDYKNPKVYDAVNDVARMIHELDPNHPATTTVAGVGEEAINDIRNRAPDLDFVSLQVYGELFSLPELIEKVGLRGPFFVTEWGATGHWEVDKTAWGAPIEATSSQKADTYLRGYREILEPLEGQLIGSFAFLWGQKQERTPTWYGMFTEAGEETETVDVMHYLWNGAWPANRAPRVRSMNLDGRVAHDSVTLSAGESYEAVVEVFDHDNDPLTYRWELKPESDTEQTGGDFEAPIASLDGLIADASSAQVRVTAPEPGAYRLFVYAYDGEGHAAHANIPFLVDGRAAR